ncbi:MAG: adenylate/guanylate cyclase domain-containing protein [Caldilineae bacterium]|nr:MAG: adenylate/guanylate cyclase domain-containing protein [Caldilineae bacterium]
MMALKIPFANRFLYPDASRPATLETRLEGTPLTRFIAELVSNSALFPILDGIRSIAENGMLPYLQELSHYVLLGSSIVQAWFLASNPKASWQNRLLGNLIGVTLYSVLEIGLEGRTFFLLPYHWLFWGFSLTLGVLSAWQSLAHQRGTAATVLLNIARVSLLPVMYYLIKLGETASIEHVTWLSIRQFVQEPSHLFIVFGALFFGLLLGLGEAQVLDYATFLRQAANKLKEYTEWSLDASLLDTAFSDEHVFELRRVERTVLFMDIRGFTAWTEKIDPAEAVAVLNQYYTLSEKIISRYRGSKPGFAADEVMTRFTDPARAAAAARDLQIRIGNFLIPHRLAVGIGIHTGVAMEGLLGSHTTKQFDIIGDTVNTAKRLESAAKAGEILISEATRQALGPGVRVKEARYLSLKGKSEPVAAYPLVI